MMRNKNCIYPEVFCQIMMHGENVYSEYYTTLRKEHEGKWYLQRFFKSVISKDKESFNFHSLEHLSMFHKEVYNNIVLGKVSLTILDSNGNTQFKLDDNQDSEQDRIQKLLMV